MKFRYRKVTPEMIVLMKELRNRKFPISYKKIGDLFNITTSTVQYHLNSEYKKKAFDRSKKFAQKNGHWKPDKKHRRKYMKNYMNDRLKNDHAFRERHLAYMRNYMQKIRNLN